MNKLLRRLSRALLENASDDSWKDPYSPSYDRQYAEDVLYHTIGPLTDSARYTENWNSPSEPPPGYKPGGPAPKWTQDEVAIAYAGDPVALYSRKPNPRSPKSGRMGAPLYRMASRIAKKYGQDPMDLYQNGYTELVRLMQPGRDQLMSPFISFAKRSIEGAVEHGIGGNIEGIKALGGEASKTDKSTKAKVKTGVKGLAALLDVKTGKQAQSIADQVKGKYQTTKSHDTHPDNPFGAFSSRFYEVASNYAQALDAGDEDQIDAARNRIEQLRTDIEDAQTPIRGASTGAGEAISTTSRRHSATYRWTKTDDGMVWAKMRYKRLPKGKVEEYIDLGHTTDELPDGDYEGQLKTVKMSKGVSSLDVEDPTTGKKQDLEAAESSSELYDATMSDDPTRTKTVQGLEESEKIYNLLKIALNTDISYVISRSPKLQKIAKDYISSRGKELFSKQFDAKTGELKDDLDLGGKLTGNEYRFVLRHLGPLASDYPGKGTVRSNTSVPRGANNWWKQGEDPEIEPIPSGGMWQSKWLREGTPSYGAEEIQQEFNEEQAEFAKLGIPFKSNVADPTKKSEYIDPKTGQVRDIAKKSTDVISRTAISAAKTKAVAKLTLLAKFIALNESSITKLMPILEGADSIDLRLLAETANRLAASLWRSVMSERIQSSVKLSNSNNYKIDGIITMPNREALLNFCESKCCDIIKESNNEAMIRFSLTDIPMLNVSATVACEQAGDNKNAYLVTVSKVAKGRSLNGSGHSFIKNAIAIK